MTTKNQDFEFHAGETVTLQIAVTDPSSGDIAKPLSTSSISWRLSSTLQPQDAKVIAKSTADAVSITSADGGVFQVALANADTRSLVPGEVLHQAIVAFPSGDVALVTEGLVNIFGAIGL